MKVFLFLTLFALASCNFTHDKHANSFSLNQFDLNAITYRDIKTYVINPKCISCHGPSEETNLSDYENVKLNMSDALRSINDGSMPKSPTSPLSFEQRALLDAWVNLGMPEGKPLESIKLEANFKSIKANIFDTKCMSCHGEGNEAFKVPLDTVTDLLNSPRELLIPGNSEESGLVLSILRDDDKRMPPPDFGDKLSEEEIAVIIDWIDKGEF